MFSRTWIQRPQLANARRQDLQLMLIPPYDKKTKQAPPRRLLWESETVETPQNLHSCKFEEARRSPTKSGVAGLADFYGTNKVCLQSNTTTD